jgi:Leucine-rich repeat (LRR) protein
MLKTLSLSRNKLRSIMTDATAAFTVSDLNVSHNRLMSVGFLARLTQMKVLRVDSNPFTSESEQSFQFA